MFMISALAAIMNALVVALGHLLMIVSCVAIFFMKGNVWSGVQTIYLKKVCCDIFLSEVSLSFNLFDFPLQFAVTHIFF